MTKPKKAGGPQPPMMVAELVALGVSEQNASDWIYTRKKKGGVDGVTASAWERHCREAEKAGITPIEAVQFCAEVGHWGFHASAYFDQQRRAGVQVHSAKTTPRTTTFSQQTTADRARKLGSLTNGRLGAAPASPPRQMSIEQPEDLRSAAEIMESENARRPRLAH